MPNPQKVSLMTILNIMGMNTKQYNRFLINQCFSIMKALVPIFAWSSKASSSNLKYFVKTYRNGNKKFWKLQTVTRKITMTVIKMPE